MTVGIVGAGLAGLAAARALVERGQEVVIFDKGRGPGGRSSARRADRFAFDHGAQYFTVRNPRFRRQVDAWLEAGVAARWEGRIVSLQAGRVRDVGEATERFVGTPAMSALAKHLARGLDVRCGERVAAVERLEGSWALFGPEGERLGGFDQLVLTAPPVQSAALIGDASPLGERASRIELRPCWAVLLAFDESYAVEFDGAFCEEAALKWIARNSSKPGRPAAEAWVLHASPEWTAAHLEEEPERVMDSLARELVRMTGLPTPSITLRDAHRWRFSLPASKLYDGCLVDREKDLVLAGDAYFGGRIEGAYLSGLAAAEALA